MPTSHETIEDTLKNLIEQFSDVYCFYRELIQNSMDAGTNRVDIYLEFKPPEKGGKDGVIIIHIDDYGEGMNREIIDNQLTRLFSSTKENDFTKIGKFGIGFVSVFAIKPQAVIVDTSRDGEDWRIIFKENMEFERIKRDYPVDGTKIQILKAGNEKFYRNFLEKSKETVIFWCKHAEVEVYFQNELINQPFDLGSKVKVYEKNPIAEVIAGYTNEEVPFYGFYNQGLTLIEGKKKFFEQIQFKIKSKYLEHTLTRDSVREDENYWKAMEVLNEIVEKKLPIKLFSGIEDELLKSKTETFNYKLFLGYALHYLLNPDKMPPECKEKKIARRVDDGFITVGDLLEMKSQDCILYDERPNDITASLSKSGKIVLKIEPNGQFLAVLEKLSQKVWKRKKIVWASRAYFQPRIVESSSLSETQKKLAFAVADLHRKMSNRNATLFFADFNYKDSCIADRLYVVQRKPGELSSVEELDKKGKNFASLFSLFSGSGALVINRNHPYILKLQELAEIDLELASYFLAKLLYMDDGVETETDSRLASLSLDKRKILE